MNKIIKILNEKSQKIEKFSAISLFCFSVFLYISDVFTKYTIHNYIWLFALITVASIQYIGIKFERIILRLVGTWFSFIVWTWLSFATINTVIDIFSVLIGIFNIIAFILLSNRISFNLIHNNKNVH
jgi:hypothetical protein